VYLRDRLALGAAQIDTSNLYSSENDRRRRFRYCYMFSILDILSRLSSPIADVCQSGAMPQRYGARQAEDTERLLMSVVTFAKARG
jgi:hypothetical protein